MKVLAWSIAALLAAGSTSFAATGAAKIAGTSEGSKVSGDLKITEDAKGLTVTGEIRGLTPGQHGFHIHEFGDCSDTAKAAGSHYNPKNTQHGDAAKHGHDKAHAGDMGNLTANEQGVAAVNVTLPGIALTGSKISAAGRAVIVHEKADDFGQPVGNAGGRVGCGLIVITGN